MSMEKYLIDFDYLYCALKKHPLLFSDKKMQEYEQLFKKLQDKIQDYESLVKSMTELTMFFEDGHTNIEIPYTFNDLCINIVCEWQGDKLILKQKYEDIENGAEIVAIEGMSLDEVIEYAATVIPHENIYLVKSRMIEYPYMNYHIFSEMNLVQMFGKKCDYKISFKQEGEVFDKYCALATYDGFLDFRENDLVYYNFRDNRAVLHLDGCIYDEKYKQILSELAQLCKEKNIEVLELDLSKNMGGSSAVIDEFISYIDVDDFSRYEMVDYSAGVPQIVSSRKDTIRNHRKETLFPKNIVCRVSNTTFSSARTFAVTLKDNHIATIFGQPTGGKPCSYGMPRRDKTPNYNIRFRVSRCLFLRPDDSLEDEVALFPEKEK